MDYETDYQRPERKYLCDFSIATRIDDVDLSNKIKDKFSSLELTVDTKKAYSIDVSFDVAIYKDIAFYKFPVERKQWQIDNLQKQRPQQIAHTIIGEVLNQQLNNICDVLKPFDIRYDSASIAGEDFNDVNRVDFCIFENKKIEEENPEDSKKGKKNKGNKMLVFNVIPHRPSLVKMAVEEFAKMAIKHAEEERIKEQEKSKHTANIKSADEIFTALAKAILEEQPKEFSSPESLAYEMIAKAHIKSDWPLEIIGYGNTIPKEPELSVDSEIDCPEYLVYTKRKNNWSLEKVTNLSAAKHAILAYGYNQKSVEQIIVLHNLKPVAFNLFVEDNGEIISITKSEAHNAKKLLLSWEHAK